MKVVFKAKFFDGPEQIVGEYLFFDDEWEEEMLDFDSKEDWLQNRGSDWAYEAVHSDCLRYWAEFDDLGD